MSKKILWFLVLVLVVAAIIAGIVLARKKENIQSNNTSSFNKNTNTTNTTKTSSNNSKKYKKIELDDGILYAIDGKKVEPDIVIGDNYFDTTISDMFINPQSYMNKNIEIEGMYLLNEPYTFVGRYSTSNLCAYCPVGYSYLEYQLQGKIDEKLEQEQSWIKVIGQLKKGNDATSNFEDYYYLSVINLEVMNERGQETVNN